MILRHRGVLQLCSLYMLRLQHHLFQSKIGDESQSHSRDASCAEPPPPLLQVDPIFAWNQVQDQNIILFLGQQGITPLT